MDLQPHQQRVVDEKAELDAKLMRLNAFVGGSVFCLLDSEERDRLERQAATMRVYSDVLAERIAAFK